MNTPAQVLHGINTELIKNIDLIKQPTMGRFISKQEFTSIKNKLISHKEVMTRDARISL